MKVVKNDNNNPLTLAEMEACRQFEGSETRGHALFRPQVASGKAVPDCLVFVERTCRFGVMFLTGGYSVEDGQWYHREDADDALVSVDDPLEDAWQRAMTAKAELKQELDIGAFFIPVVVFTDMAPDTTSWTNCRAAERGCCGVWGASSSGCCSFRPRPTSIPG